MPNNFGGKGFKKGKKGNRSRESRELILKDPNENENYGLVKSAKGGGRFDIETPDGLRTMGILPGKYKKRMWINVGDIVLIGIWDFQVGKCSIIHKYSEEHVHKLIEKKEILSTFQRDNLAQFAETDIEEDYFTSELSTEELDDEIDVIDEIDEIDVNDI